MFENRTDAGGRLGDRLVEEGVDADVVLAIPRGGLPVGRAVADRLGAPLDVVVASKLGAPHNPELAIGAVAGDVSVWLNDDLVEHLGVRSSYVEDAREKEAEAARRKVEQYRGGEALPDLAGERVVLVDDGLATGATAIACLRQIRKADAARTVLAVPVAPADAAEGLRDEADEVVCLETPARFGAVGAYYRDFSQVSDAEALEYLDRE
ncbi:phosphoribosyltransferase [Halegenticoccus tardaugens]|uniref:phosphoribosyltransferase n=1 Tax=Halegenticoccus tardaugens TaxID=2071624 RepID=UPI00100AFE7B|nr:phosphoribosyltransferase family protein [Halegenticoccus tardaugens]